MLAVPKNRFEVRVLREDDGGGYLITFPDLPGCMSDGGTVEEAIANAADAENCWLTADAKWSRADKPERFVARIPAWIYRSLRVRAKQEGTSMNSLVVSAVSKELGLRKSA